MNIPNILQEIYPCTSLYFICNYSFLMPNINHLCYILSVFAFVLSVTDSYGFGNLQMFSFFSKLTATKHSNFSRVLDLCSHILILCCIKLLISFSDDATDIYAVSSVKCSRIKETEKSFNLSYTGAWRMKLGNFFCNCSLLLGFSVFSVRQ